MCDTTYSDSSAPDGRGIAVAAVDIENVSLSMNNVCIRGTLKSGETYDFRLPNLHRQCAVECLDYYFH